MSKINSVRHFRTSNVRGSIDIQKNNFAALSVMNGRKKAYCLPAALPNEFSELFI
jgi:hypothetical protein